VVLSVLQSYKKFYSAFVACEPSRHIICLLFCVLVLQVHIAGSIYRNVIVYYWYIIGIGTLDISFFNISDILLYWWQLQYW